MNQITRQSIDALLQNQRQNEALAQIRALYNASPNLGNAQFVLNTLPKIPSRKNTTCRVAFLRSFTLEPVAPLLKAQALLAGLEVTPWFCDFNAYAQQLLDPDSDLYRFQPDVVVLALQTRDMLPDLWQRFAQLSDQDVDRLLQQTQNDLRTWIDALRAHSQAHLILHNLQLPEQAAQGILDTQVAHSQNAALMRLNAQIQRLAAEYTGVFVLDYDALTARYGRQRWQDERKWLTMRMPIAADALPLLAQEYVRFLLPLTGRICKALVVDLDNTLWGGVVGEDGLHGIRIGTEYPAAAFLQLQRALLDLAQRGILLAICSKNNEPEVLEVFEKRPEMLLKPSHFAAQRINWQDKAQNLREIAAELNLGLEALAFLDDNPVERQRIQLELPEVTVLELPDDPMEYADIVHACPVFERLSLSVEDRERGRYYAEQRQRRELEQSAGTLEDYLRSLHMEATLELVSASTLGRVAQLTQKTNQFNLTTRRYSEQQLSDLAQDPCWEVVCLRLTDRFGDNGLVGVALLHHQGATSEIDTLLLSCRVIGRTVETAFLAHLEQRSRDRGASVLCGWFLPSAKNAPAKDCYRVHGFTPVSEQGVGVLWERQAGQAPLRCPEWIACRIIEGVSV